MQLKILNPYKNHPHQGREYDTAHYDTFHRNEILFNYVINKLYQLKDKDLSKDVRWKDGGSYLYQGGMNHLLQMKNLWGIDDRKNSILRSIWENVCRCDRDNEWKIPYIKSIGKHKYLKKVLSKNNV